MYHFSAGRSANLPDWDINSEMQELLYADLMH